MCFHVHMERWLWLPLVFLSLGLVQNQQWPQSVTGGPACALTVTSGSHSTVLTRGSLADPGHPLLIDPVAKTSWELNGPSEADSQQRPNDLVWRIYLFDVPIFAQQARGTSFLGSNQANNILPFATVGLARLVIDVQAADGQCSFDTWVQIPGDPTFTPTWFISLGIILVALFGIFYSLPVRYRAVEAETKVR
jgi:hypothetical protein